MTKRPTRYGLPYKGSKNKIADWVCDQLAWAIVADLTNL